jgi:hypothetical protein
MNLKTQNREYGGILNFCTRARFSTPAQAEGPPLFSLSKSNHFRDVFVSPNSQSLDIISTDRPHSFCSLRFSVD